MSTKLIELNDRIITDKGEVVAKYELLVQKALSGELFTKILALPHDDIDRYNQMSGGEHPIVTWEDTGEDSMEGPDPETFDWSLPKKYLDLDIWGLCSASLIAQKKMTDEYVSRVSWELDQMEKRNMFPFVRCLLYVTDRFRDEGVVWGVGRGSSCASLVMYLLDINKVDPVKYDIPTEEFFK